MLAKRSIIFLYGLAALLAAFTYFYGLDSQYIPKNGDEYPYEHITRLTADSGHLLPLQSRLDNMRNTKPPLLFWQGIASTHWGQDWDLWHLRYPSVIYTLLTALLVFLLAGKLSGQPETGLLALLAYLAFFSTYRYGRPFLANPPEVFWMFLPFFTLLYWRPASFESRLLMPLLLGAQLGIGLLYKSFALLAPAGLALAWWYLREREYRWRAFLARDVGKLAMASILALGVFGLWFMFDPDPQSVWREFVIGENIGKFDPHEGSYLSKLLWGGSSVWAMLVGYPMNAGLLAFPVVALFFESYKRRAQLSEAEKLLWIWMGVLLLIFTFPSQRSSRYLLEGMPALAVLCALNWERINRKVFAASLIAAGCVLALIIFLSLRLQDELGGGLYPAGFWLVIAIASATVLLALLLPRLTRPLVSVTVLLVYLSFAAFLHPFDGATGNYSAEAQQYAKGKAVWTPCDFRAKDEGHRFLLPGAQVYGYYENPALTPSELAKHYRLFAVQLPLQEDAACAGCRVIGQRLEIRGRQSDEEIRDMLKGNIFQHLFRKELLVESAAAPVDASLETGCR